LVVTATILQVPSNVAAMAGESQQTIAKAVDRAKAQIRLPIMDVLMRVLDRLRREAGKLHQLR
jgi:hypothetical protein